MAYRHLDDTLVFRLIPNAIFVIALSGCAQSPFLDAIAEVNPFEREDPTEGGRFGPTPTEHIVVLQKLESQASGLEPAEKHRLAADLVQRLQMEDDPLVRAAIVRALGNFSTPAALPGLTAGLEDPEAEVRIVACQAWRNFGGPESVSRLSETVANDVDVDVRLAAVRSTEGLNEPRILQALSIALDDPNPVVQYRAIESLKSVSDVDYGGDVAAWRQFAQGGHPQRPPKPSFTQRFKNLF